MQMMGDGVAIVPTAPEQVRNRDVHYPYRPDSDFYYLTGFAEPEAVAVLAPGRAQGEFVLFCRERDPEKEIWNGRRAGLEGAVSRFGADDAFPVEDIGDILPGLLENCAKVYCNLGLYPEFDSRLLRWLNEVKDKSRAGINAPSELVDLDHILHELRLVKRGEEVRLMRRAARVSAQAHRRAMQVCRPGMMEYEIQAELEHEFRRAGSNAPAYPPIVAGGRNACILHYTENADELHGGDLLLIDAGAELECYAADITRTFPVAGSFRAEQRAVYEVVLAAQKAAIEQVRVGSKWNDPHDAAVRVLAQGLVDLGILEGNAEAVIESEAYRRLYMHRTGHWLGMDVHDVGDYKVDGIWRELEAGMTLTVEPGLYIPGDSDIDARWRGIGVRIEDDVLVTRDGPDVLSRDAPKEIADIEALMAG